jgi:restriction system protein
MGAVWIRGAELLGFLSDFVGYKAGLALSATDLRGYLEPAGLWSVVPVDLDAVIRLRSEEIEEMTDQPLVSVGNIEGPAGPGVVIAVYRKYAVDPGDRKVFDSVSKAFVSFLESATQGDEKHVDPSPFLNEIEKSHGRLGLTMAIELFQSAATAMHRSPWSRTRVQEWVNIVELNELFKSESLTTPYGEYFDQRFIDFLFANFDEVDRINWRKFEGLAAEFFARAGFAVQIGPGRNDDGVDIRLWPKEEDRHLPPATLVQCKREKAKIQKVVVKALWADISAEGASTGIIVTTSSLARGANKVAKARGYPIWAVNRSALHRWIGAMRSPWTGVFLGE